MAEVVWTEPALHDLEAIAEVIALDKPDAAKALVARIFKHVGQLSTHPECGSRPGELRSLPYRQIVEPPCRIFYRYDRERVYIVHVMRGEMKIRMERLKKLS